jgi:hypothetical protein
MEWCRSFTSSTVMGRLCHSQSTAVRSFTRFEVFTGDSELRTLSLGFISF